MTPERSLHEVLYDLFRKNYFDDQVDYYQKTRLRYERLSKFVDNRRLMASALTILFSALVSLTAGFLASRASCSPGATPTPDSICTAGEWFVLALVVLTAILPGFGWLLSTLLELYQWTRFTELYESAQNNLQYVESSISPDPLMNDEEFVASVRDFANNSIKVLVDESAQWGQLNRTPLDINQRLVESRNGT
jgi:hypothetical protein